MIPARFRKALRAVVPRLKAAPAQEEKPIILPELLPALLPIATVIDVGASDGRWSRKMATQLPDAHYVLIEPQRYNDAAGPRHSRWIHAVAGAQAGTVSLFIGDYMLGAGIYDVPGVDVPVVRLDDAITESGPFLLKMDTHGYEIPILEGARDILQRTTAVMMECYNFNVSPTALRFERMVLEMESRGFRVAAIVDPSYRDDGCLWQLDIVFLRADNPIYHRESYRKPVTPPENW